MTLVTAQTASVLLKYLGLTHQTRMESSISTQSVLAEVFVIAPLENVSALMDMKERPARDRVVRMGALAMEHANGLINFPTNLHGESTAAVLELLISLVLVN